MIPALLAVLGAASQSPQVELYRGVMIDGQGYWSVSDTFLDSSDADTAKGGLFTLEGGKGRTILIRFADLERFMPRGMKVVDATLYLSPSSPDKPELAGVSVLKSPWGEGPMFVAALGRALEEKPVRGAATWKQRRREIADWQQSGATGPEDATPIPGASMEVRDKEIAIRGLAATVESARDRWYENHGLALTFSGKCEFFSSQAKNGKPRLVVTFASQPSPAGPDLSAQWLVQDSKAGEATYRAIVKNVGDQASQPFFGQWIVAENPGGKFSVNKSLAPGEETVIEFNKEFRPNSTDHRAKPLMFRVYPATAERNANNDAVEIYEDAVPVAFEGAKIDADSMQMWARTVNDAFFAQSRFSFAPEGVVERIRLVPDQASAEWVLNLAGVEDDRDRTRRLIALLTGLATTPPRQTVNIDGQTVTIADPYPGLNGFGDTRYEGLIPAGIPMLYAPVASPLFDTLPVEPTDLLSATETAAINSAIGRRGKDRLGVLWDQPSTIVLRASDMTGRPLDGAELAFYQLERNDVPSVPTYTILTKNGGTVIMENRGEVNGVIDKDALHQFKKNPFGNLRTDGSNGTFLVRALINGETEWGWLKAWQLTDAFHRGNKAAAIIDIRFNAPSGPLDRTTNLAKGRLVSDKAGNLPAQLAPLVDDDPATEGSLGANVDDWIEIDLGRDRPIGEVQLTLKGEAMPQKFDIQLYATGQTAPALDAWVKDLDHRWTRTNRLKADGTIAYRGPMIRARFVRIVNRSGGAGKLAEIRVFPLKDDR